MSAPGRTFRRSLSARVLSLLTTMFLVAAVAARLAAGELGVGFWIITLLAALSLLSLIGAWGDRIRLDDEGLEVRNVLWSLFGLSGRRLFWRDVVSVREHRRLRAGGAESPVSALFLVPRSGRRLVLDSLGDFEAARAMVARFCGSPLNTPTSGPPR